APDLIGIDVADQQSVDAKLLALDSSPKKSVLGANAILGVSLAAAHAGASVRQLPLYRHLFDCLKNVARDSAPSEPRMPLPMTNMISGGLHAGHNLDFQDILVIPTAAPSFSVGLEWIVRFYKHLGKQLTKAGYEGFLVGDEGGYGPRLQNNAQAIDFVIRAIEAARLRPGIDMTIALDVAATHFY